MMKPDFWSRYANIDKDRRRILIPGIAAIELSSAIQEHAAIYRTGKDGIMSGLDAPVVLTIVEIGMHAFERDGEVETKR